MSGSRWAAAHVASPPARFSDACTPVGVPSSARASGEQQHLLQSMLSRQPLVVSRWEAAPLLPECTQHQLHARTSTCRSSMMHHGGHQVPVLRPGRVWRAGHRDGAAGQLPAGAQRGHHLPGAHPHQQGCGRGPGLRALGHRRPAHEPHGPLPPGHHQGLPLAPLSWCCAAGTCLPGLRGCS